MRKFDEKYIFGSNKKIFKLGWKPKLGIKDILEIYVNFMRRKKTKISVFIVTKIDQRAQDF